MSWRSLIIGAVAESHEFFSPGFVAEAERCSPFRFEFLRARRDRLASRQGLYSSLFDAFLEDDDGELLLPDPVACARRDIPCEDLVGAAEVPGFVRAGQQTIGDR